MRRPSFFWGIVVLLIGLYLLINNLFPQLNLGNYFWSIALILLGLWFLFGSLFVRKSSVETTAVNIQLEDAREALISLRHGAGRLNITPAAPGALVTGTCDGGVEQSVQRAAGRAEVKLKSDVAVIWPNISAPNGLNWNLQLSPEIPLRIDAETGASESNMDLTNLKVTELRIQTGASSSRVNLPAAAGYSQVKVEAGAASVELRVPEGVAARIHTETGLVGLKVDPQRFPATGTNSYESPDFISAANKVEIKVEAGVGSIDIR